MEQETFRKQLKELSHKENLGGLDIFIQSLSAEDLNTYKTDLVDACLSMFSIWYYYVVADKITEGDEEEVISDLLDILTCAEKINPEIIYYEERAQCYEYLSDIKTIQNEKLYYIGKAIDEYSSALRNQGSVELNTRLGNALLDKILINEQFTDEEFTEVLQLFKLAFTEYSEDVFKSFLYASFRILSFPTDRNNHWHAQFINQLNSSANNFAQKDPIIYLTWSEELKRITEHDIPPAYTEELNKKSVELLEALTDYQTNDTALLNRLGAAFHKSAQDLRYYQFALNYFTQGHSINPAAWTFPVYATNVQLAMARIYHQENNLAKVIELFESGKALFPITYEYEKGITLTLRWAEFLIEYARLAYDFHAPDILKEAEEKLLVAKEIGEKSYRTPYIGLAKVALKTGDHQKCLDILYECKSIFTNKYYEYDFEDVLNDEDFKEISDRLKKA